MSEAEKFVDDLESFLVWCETGALGHECGGTCVECRVYIRYYDYKGNLTEELPHADDCGVAALMSRLSYLRGISGV